jgi:putative intracellular protease/amidase
MAEAATFEILCVCTSNDVSSWGAQTGLWLEELAIPYYIFQEAGYKVDICSIKGSTPPIDPAALNDDESMKDGTRKFIEDTEAQEIFKNTKSLASIVASGQIKNYICIYLVGGHGCIGDFPGNIDIQEAVEWVYGETKGCVAAICHGPLGLTDCKIKDVSLMKGKFIAAFSNEEENILGLLNVATVLTEDKMDECGAVCVPGPPW